ncbi:MULTISPECIES: radical SAM protein [Nitrospirillum]|uniref:Radical SAM protein with 4Fe4S-binding SPASM domain n=1 Tax=Nitrospirillum amazonense TaxID=28077 RepID=A0A560F5W1_9PROT|nr:radical SAM protein [Nitrospirillum amazonense]MEC4593115.1 radical SAM protein [Nitrospirillum amazonense]TWB17010.1 radical SAM protein with 4Fe4S-binding SPASM domain [Nitrospirillum amazonense]
MIVVWRVVTACNLTCPFCAYDRRLAIPRPAADIAEIRRLAGLLADYQAESGDEVLVSWLGGEPLLWQPLADLTAAVRGLGLAVSATTNGTSLGSPAVRAQVVAHYRELTISVDGVGGAHDSLRGWDGGFSKLGTWIPTLAAETRAAASALKIKVNVVLTRRTLRDFNTLCQTVADWGVTEITFNQLGGRDRPEFYPDHRLRPHDLDRLEELLPPLRRDLLDRGVTLVGGTAYLERFRASAWDRPMPVEDCGPGERFLFIDEAGRMAPCSFTAEDYGIDLSSVRTVTDIADLPRRFRQLSQAARSRHCDDCLSTQICDKFKRQPASAAA